MLGECRVLTLMRAVVLHCLFQRMLGWEGADSGCHGGLLIPPLLLNGLCGEKGSNGPKSHVFMQFKPLGIACVLWLPRG